MLPLGEGFRRYFHSPAIGLLVFLIHSSPCLGASDEKKTTETKGETSTIEKIGADIGVKPTTSTPRGTPSPSPAGDSSTSAGRPDVDDTVSDVLGVIGKILDGATWDSGPKKPRPSQPTVWEPRTAYTLHGLRRAYRHPWRRDVRLQFFSSNHLSGVGAGAGIRKIGRYGIDVETMSLMDARPRTGKEMLFLSAHPYASLAPSRLVEFELGGGVYMGRKVVSGEDSKTGASLLFRTIGLPYTPWILEAGTEISRINGQLLYEPRMDLGVKVFPFAFSGTGRAIVTRSQSVLLLGISLGTSF